MTRRADRAGTAGRNGRRGAPERTAAVVRVALARDQAAALDAWIDSHPEPRPFRPEAVRRLMICALVDHPGQ